MSHATALNADRATQQAAPKRHTSPTKRKQHLAAYLFLLPFFIVFITMLVIPLVYAGYLSLFESKLIGGEVFAGLANYGRALTDPAVPREPRPGRACSSSSRCRSCWACHSSSRSRSTRCAPAGPRRIRLLIFMPYAVPAVVATLMWGYLYGADFGPLAQIARVGRASARPTSSRPRTSSAR